jgi:hypothetical protein
MLLPSKDPMGSHDVYATNGDAMGLKEMFVFGPQCLSFDQQAAHQLRSQLFGDSKLSWMLDALQDLRKYWSDLVLAIPLLEHLDGERLLERLAAWVESGHNDLLVWPLPNIILTPLVVVLHLVELETHIKQPSENHESCAHALNGVSEVLGLCTGLLSSAAVACSSDGRQLTENGSVAIRLAMLIGAVVDAKDFSLPEPERATSISVLWTQTGGAKIMEEILHTTPPVCSSSFSVLLFFAPQTIH